jgi:hypothetical protein
VGISLLGLGGSSESIEPRSSGVHLVPPSLIEQERLDFRAELFKSPFPMRKGTSFSSLLHCCKSSNLRNLPPQCLDLVDLLGLLALNNPLL